MTVTRASHVVLGVAELDRSLPFYERVLGLVLTAREDGVAYLRGVEERCHHSVVLREGAPTCPAIGFRVWDEAALNATAGDAPRVERAHQGPTALLRDPAGVPVELCAGMETRERRITRFSAYAGGAAQRLDHFQLHHPAVGAGCAFWESLGMRLSEVIGVEGEEPVGVFLQRKGNPHDVVLFAGPGPRLHHVAFTTPDVGTLLHACDVAGELGYGDQVERGPGRHGPGHALFVYFRDPDGHRIELFTTHYQTLDAEDDPVRWTPGDPKIAVPWGLPAQRSWHAEATPFDGAEVVVPDGYVEPLTLERHLGVA